MIIDVREPSEYTQGHVEGSVNIPLGDIEHRLDEIPSDQEVILYCRSGGRAGVAAQILTTAGYSQVINGINQQQVEATYGTA